MTLCVNQEMVLLRDDTVQWVIQYTSQWPWLAVHDLITLELNTLCLTHFFMSPFQFLTGSIMLNIVLVYKVESMTKNPKLSAYVLERERSKG